MSKILLEAKKIYKHYPGEETLTLLNGIDLTLERGKSLAIMGRSGEGKSTLLHILGTLEPASSGEIFYEGTRTTEQDLHTLRNEKIGFVFQNFNLLEEYSVLDNILLPCLIARKDKTQSREKALKLLELVGLTQRQHFLAKKLSGGEKQRVAIARALINDPLLILADEPSGNVDAHQAETIHHLLLDCVKKYDKALIVVTHDPNLASLCDHIVHLKEGLLHVQAPF